MPNRFWAFNRLQTIVLLVLAIGVGIVGAVLLGGTSGDRGTVTSLSVRPVEVGTRGSSHALWVFGLETLRFDAELRGVGRLGVAGFGSVLGCDGEVYMYDPGTARVGVLHTARNRLELIGRVPGGATEQSPFAQLVAHDGRALWLVPLPGMLQRFDLATQAVSAPTNVDTDRAPILSGVVAASGTVIVATQDASGIALSRVDPSSTAVTATVRVDLTGAFALDGLATDGTRVWMIANDTAYSFDATTLARWGVVRLGVASNAARGAVIVDQALWVLADNGATLVKVDNNEKVTTVLRILREPLPAFRIPASLVSDAKRIYAMVQTGTRSGDHQVRIVGYDVATNKMSRGIELPSKIFAGAITIT
jgi:hypothetical protein